MKQLPVLPMVACGLARFVLPLLLLVLTILGMFTVLLWSEVHPLAGLALLLASAFLFAWDSEDVRLPARARIALALGSCLVLAAGAWAWQHEITWFAERPDAFEDDATEGHLLVLALGQPLLVLAALGVIGALGGSKQLALGTLAACFLLCIYAVVLSLAFGLNLASTG